MIDNWGTTHNQSYTFFVVDDFGINYVDVKDAQHLLNITKDHYKAKVDLLQSPPGVDNKDYYVDLPFQDSSENNSKNMSTNEKGHLETACTQTPLRSIEKSAQDPS